MRPPAEFIPPGIRYAFAPIRPFLLATTLKICDGLRLQTGTRGAAVIVCAHEAVLTRRVNERYGDFSPVILGLDCGAGHKANHEQRHRGYFDNADEPFRSPA